jgi:membrane fusion protein (multidrug efflux system)
MLRSDTSRPKKAASRAVQLFLVGIAGAGTLAGALSVIPTAAEAAPTVRAREIRAQLTPRRYTTVSAEVGARVSDIHVSEGGYFKKGQTLVSFDCSMQRAQLNKSEADLAAATQTYAANKRLAELNSVGQIELDTSAAARSKAAADVEMSRTLIRKCSIAAPYSGRVAEQRAREQQFVQAGQPLLEILDDSALELEYLVPSRWLVWLKPGARFFVKIDETGKTYPATVVRTGARIDPVSQSIKIKGQVAGRYPELLAGMSGVVSFPISTPKKK